MELFKLPGHTQILAPHFDSSSDLPRSRRSIRPSQLRLSSAASMSPAPDKKKRMFVFGTGFVGRYVSGRLMREGGWDVSGTCTSAVKKKDLEDVGIDAYVFNATKSKLIELSSLKYATHVLVSIPPSEEAGDHLLSFGNDLQNLLSHGNLKWLCYLSSTSVYGDCGGALIDEDYPADPVLRSAKARLAAEQGWLNMGQSLWAATYVFRLGGIYGPGRSALDTILKGQPLSNNQRMRGYGRFTSRVHVADIYQAIKASFDVPFGGVFNVVDDDPARRAEVFAFAWELIKEKQLGRMEDKAFRNYLDPATPDENMKGEKRVSNARLKKKLGVKLLYPSYRHGLRSILNSW